MNYFDMHCDTIYKTCNDGSNILNSDGHISIEKAEFLESYGQIFALFCGEDICSKEQYDIRFEKLLAEAEKQFLNNSDKIMLCKNSYDLKKCINDGKIAAVLAVEGAELITCESALQKAYNKGVRFITITWNHKNQYGCGAFTANEGLSEKGKDLIRKIEGVGIVPDVSHLSEKGFWDVYNNTKQPFVATHSNSKTICKHKRNLTDEQFLAIKDRSGLVGINIYSKFLTESEEAQISDIICHIDHFLSLGGEKIIALGFDFDGCDNLPKGIKDIRNIDKIYNELLRRNYNEHLVTDIFYNNLFEFLNDRM